MTVPVPALGLMSAVSFAFARVFLKRGLASSTPLTAIVIGVAFTAAFLLVFVSFTASFSLLFSRQILPFVVAGLIAPGISRLLVYVGVDRVGTSRATALNSTTPLFGIVLAILFLGERPSGGLLIGAACVFGGCVLLSQQGRTDRGWRRRDMLYPVTGAFGFAVRDNISRWGMRVFPHPAVAALAATLVSVAVISAFGLYRRAELRADRTGLIFLALSGFGEGVASLLLWAALAAGEVSAVTPLVHSTPIFTVALAGLLLRDLERVTWRIVVAALAIVTGAGIVIRG